MLLSELHYDLPAERIAQTPVEPRDASRLLVLERASGRIEHRRFRDVVEYVSPGDCLVLNNSRVMPARFFARRATGGLVEGLFLRSEAGHVPQAGGATVASRVTPSEEHEAMLADGWRVLLKPSARLHEGERLEILLHNRQAPARSGLRLLRREERGEWLVAPDQPIDPLTWLAEVGRPPLPPYIHQASPADAERYQTVYAAAPGSAAAPTAGLHFTPQLLEELALRGVRRAEVTLHVGPGTFVPVVCENLVDHVMHREWYSCGSAARATIRATRAAGGAIVAVGTTSARVLESLGAPENWDAHRAGDEEQGDGAGPAWTDIFIYPPYRWRLVDRLITNFHLPGSTLLALVMALAGRDLIRHAYHEAIREEYRFYSYGDAMLIV